jgi:hypothetical protein
MTRKSRREIERAIEELTRTDGPRETAAVELENGEYVTPSGDAVDWDAVTFKIPYSLWSETWGLDAPEEIHDPEAYDT